MNTVKYNLGVFAFLMLLTPLFSVNATGADSQAHLTETSSQFLAADIGRDPTGTNRPFSAGLDTVGSDGQVDLSKEQDVTAIIIAVIKFALGFLAALAILVIIISGILYITSGGNEDRIETAKTYLIFAIVGLIVALLGYVIVNAVSQALL